MLLDTGKVKIKITFSFAAVITLMLLFCNEEIVVLSLFSSLFHEGGHLFFLKLFSASLDKITFGAFGIRIDRAENSILEAKKEVFIALGGIFGNIFLIIIGIFFIYVYNSPWAIKLVIVNSFIAFSNMLPLEALDFGRALSIMLFYFLPFEKADRILKLISLVVAVICLAFSICYNVLYGFNLSLIAFSVYLCLITVIMKGR